MRANLITFLISTLCVGCALSGGHQRVLIPLADRVQRITVMMNPAMMDGGSPAPTYPLIDDRERIAQAIAFLKAHSNDWTTPAAEAPAYIYALEIETEGGKHLLVKFSGEWIGGPVDGKDKMQKITAKEAGKFREILQIASPVERKATQNSQ